MNEQTEYELIVKSGSVTAEQIEQILNRGGLKAAAFEVQEQ